MNTFFRYTLCFCLCFAILSGCQSTGSPPISDASEGDLKVESNPQVLLLDPKRGLRTGNLWHNLVANFQIPPHTQHPQVQAQIQWFKKNPDYLVRTTQRATPYMYLIHEQVQQKNLPSEVVLLPMIESAYYPFSYSGAGAAGLWQLMPGTANDLGVKRNRWYDGRRDVFISTHAALNYLVYLRQKFKGDWLLAIAAYDAGPGRVQNAINRNQQRGQPTDFWSLDLPEETRAYVPRFLALANIVQNPNAYGVTLPAINDQPYLAQVNVGSQIHLKEAARLANISLEDLKHLNPGYHRATTDPSGNWHLLLPLDKVDIFKKNLAGATRSTQTVWGHHKVQPKETLKMIAEQYHTTVEELKKTNRLTHDTLQPNTVLLIPTVTQVIGAPTETETKPHSVALKKFVPKTGLGYYRVYYGDTLNSISKKFGVSITQIQKWNRLMNGEQVWPGQMLIVRKNVRQ